MAAKRSNRTSVPGTGGLSANHTPGAPTPSMASEIAKNAQWYQMITLRMRVTAICSMSTVRRHERDRDPSANAVVQGHSEPTLLNRWRPEKKRR
jgi:hypothetical protein